MRKRYLPRSLPESFDQVLVYAFCAAATALSISDADPREIWLSTSSVAGLIVGKCFLPDTKEPLIKWPYLGLIVTIARDSNAGAYSKVIVSSLY